MKKVLHTSSFQRKLESSISFIFKSVLDSSFRWNDDESTDLLILGQTREKGLLLKKNRLVGNDAEMIDSLPSVRLPPWEWILANISTLDAVGGIKPFPDYDFVRELVRALIENRLLIVAKSRQMMATWTVAAYYLYRALYDEPGVYLCISKGARDSRELLKRLKIMVNNLPGDLKKMARILQEEAVFVNGSRVISLPATEFAPRMHSPAGVFWDEMAFTPESEGIWTSLKPAIDSGGTFAGISSPNGTDNIFYELFSDDKNGFGKLRLHWQDHPLRDEIWREAAANGLSKARWQQEYEVDFNVLADRVFEEFDPEVHVLPKPFDPIGLEGTIYRGLDFGCHHPYVVWVHLALTDQMTVFAEWECADKTIAQVAAAIKKIDARFRLTESNIRFTACDPAGAAVGNEGIPATDRLKELGVKLVWRSSRISSGVDLIKSLLSDANGKTRLQFSPLVERTIFHLKHYRWDKGTEKPCKTDGHDHACDALRYLIVNLHGRKKVAWSGGKVAGVSEG